jgi:hypothetical protein
MPDHQPQSQIQRSAATVNVPQLGAALAPCTYIAVQCSHCGDLRLALAAPPSSAAIHCPQCGASCPFVLLATGFTRRKLPFLEIPRVPTKLLARRDEIPVDDPPTLNLSG